MRCLIVDDEIHCRHELRHLLGMYPDTLVVGDCGSIAHARQQIPALQPDVLFLDIQLGLHSGFDLLHQLPAQPLTVFVTAFDNYALHAFTVDAVDYLLKPVLPERLASTLKRVCQRLASREQRPAAFPASSIKPNELLIPLASTGNATAIHDILMIEARNHHSRVTLSSGNACSVRRAMREWQNILPVQTFMQIDRSMLINLDHIVSVECSSRSGSLILGPLRIPVAIGRTGSARLRQLLLRRSQFSR